MPSTPKPSHFGAACAAQSSPQLSGLPSRALTVLPTGWGVQIYGVRKPMSNLQMQQNTLLKMSEAFRFLAKHNKQVAIELRNEYVDTFSKVHATYVHLLRTPAWAMGWSIDGAQPRSPPPLCLA
jgi:hypothetical protein